VTLVEMCSHLATERAGMGTLHLTVARPSSIPTPVLFGRRLEPIENRNRTIPPTVQLCYLKRRGAVNDSGTPGSPPTRDGLKTKVKNAYAANLQHVIPVGATKAS